MKEICLQPSFFSYGHWGFVAFLNGFPLCNLMCQRSVQSSLTTWKTGRAAFLQLLASGKWKAEMWKGQSTGGCMRDLQSMEAGVNEFLDSSF